MKSIKISDFKAFTEEFLKVYLANGLGSAPKREIDILVTSLLMKYGDLTKESNHNLSILLQVSESTIKRLRYEAKLKYPPDDEYIKREFLFILANSQFEAENIEETDVENLKLIFIMEDNYLRYAIQGRLKEKGMFADTSFNSEIIKISCGSLVNVIEEFYGKETADEFLGVFESLIHSNDDVNNSQLKEYLHSFVIDTAISVLTGVAVAVLKSKLGLA